MIIAELSQQNIMRLHNILLTFYAFATIINTEITHMRRKERSMENLRREMAAKHIEIKDLAELWHVHRNTASAKVNGKRPITIEEAFKAQETYFPECTLTYLFSK